MDDLEFFPDWKSALGDTILDILEERNISMDEFSKMMNWTKGHIEDLLSGQKQITLEIARLLSSILGSSVEF